ncbi:MAG TPA: DNA glycosylase, partial [Ruminiclostridium sp.]|nr:DNA glycosylase [Ruminiclostridium sp.]
MPLRDESFQPNQATYHQLNPDLFYISHEFEVSSVKYRGYTVIEKQGTITVERVNDFNPVHIFECGQCFRWERQNDGSYTGIAGGRAVNVGYSDGRLVIRNSSIEDFTSLWFDYLDLGRDYSTIKEQLRKDKIMEKAIDFGYGIRLLKQDIWETLISFIISANNRIPMIMKTVAAISKLYGDEIFFDGGTYYSFSGADRLSDTSVQDLEACRGGFRCKYIVQTSG